VPRSAAIDWLRAIGIILVVYGHSLGGPVSFVDVVYAFHMPLFFFLSGFVLKPAKAALGFLAFVKQLSKSILVPYLVFGIFGYLVWFLVLRRFGSFAGDKLPPWKPFVAFLYGSSGPKSEYWMQPIVLWFFPCLFATQILTWGILRLPALLLALAAIGCLILADLLRMVPLPFGLETAFMACLFMLLGYWLANHSTFASGMRRWAFVTVPLLLFVATAGAVWNGNVNLAKSNWGHNIIVYLLVAVAFITALYVVAAILPRSTLVEKISAATIVIFPLHSLGFSGLTFVYIYIFRKTPAFRQHVSVGMAATFLIVSVLVMLAPWVNRMLSRMTSGTPRSVGHIGTVDPAR
jgi:acyltransferase